MCIHLFFTESTLPGFIQDETISVSYNGHKSSVDWKENGIQLQFEDNKSENYSNTRIQISTGSLGYTRMPNEVESVSKVYHIHSSKIPETSVTIRIKHNEPNDIHNLYFFTCSEDIPPYDFTYLPGGTFTSTYGEIVVSKFSFFKIGKFFSGHRVRSVLSWWEKSYDVSLYRGTVPYSRSSELCFNLYVSLVKNCNTFRQGVKSFIKEEYKEDVQLVSNFVTRFNPTHTKVTVYGEITPSDANLDEPDCTFLRKTQINNYVNASPPFLKYRLRYKSGSSVTVKFNLTGLQDIDHLTMSPYDLPGNKYNILGIYFILKLLFNRFYSSHNA